MLPSSKCIFNYPAITIVIFSFLYICILDYNTSIFYLNTVYYRGCLLVRQNFFHNDPKNFADVGGGVLGCRGFHSSFRATQSGLSLNIGSIFIPYSTFLYNYLLSNFSQSSKLSRCHDYHDNSTWPCGGFLNF
jgi:hypothetical protein